MSWCKAVCKCADSATQAATNEKMHKDTSQGRPQAESNESVTEGLTAPGEWNVLGMGGSLNALKSAHLS